MDKYVSQEEYKKMLMELQKGIDEVSKEHSQIELEMQKLDETLNNIESAQSIINSIKETANIVNNTVSPMEFFDGYEKLYYLVSKLESVPDIEYTQQSPDEIRIELQGQRKPAIQNMIGRYYNHVISMDGSVNAFYNTLSKYFSYMDNDHINYINSLCENGNKNQSDNAKKIRKFKEFYLNFAYITNRILLPPAKIAFILWTLFWIVGTSSLFDDIPFILIGYIVLCGIFDLVYFINRKKYIDYKIKITQKKISRIKKLMQQVDPVAYQRDFANTNNPSTIKNNTTNYDYMNGHQFEYFCADVLRKNGFKNVEVTQGSGDHGIDILAEKYGITYAIQCKCYSDNVGNSAVQQAHTGKSLYHRDIAVVLTNQYFTSQAKEEAFTLGVKLWDRDKLNELIEEKPYNKFGSNKTKSEDNVIKNDTINAPMEDKKNISKRQTSKFDLDTFAAQCNAYVVREERKKDIND